MSETITVGSASETIHGTFSAADDYNSLNYGDAYDTWNALSDDNKKKTLAAAVRYLNAQTWADDYDTFAERDAVAAFATAQYELAVLIASDASVVQAIDQSSNISSVGAGGASVSYFAPQTVANGTATKLPPVVQRLVGQYLGTSGVTVFGGYGQEGDEDSPFSDCEDYERGEPY